MEARRQSRLTAISQIGFPLGMTLQFFARVKIGTRGIFARLKKKTVPKPTETFATQNKGSPH